MKNNEKATILQPVGVTGNSTEIDIKPPSAPKELLVVLRLLENLMDEDEGYDYTEEDKE